MKTPRFGKQIGEQRLPNRAALNTLTKGDPSRRTLNDYAKETPGMLDAPGDTILQPARPLGKSVP